MIDPKNTVTLTGGVVADPEVINDNILKLRVAVDLAGAEKGVKSPSGYFDVTYYFNNEGNTRNAEFIKNQVTEGKLKKGSQISLVGRLVQERWSTDEKKGAKVVVVAEAITYAGSSAPRTETATANGPSQADLPSEF